MAKIGMIELTFEDLARLLGTKAVIGVEVNLSVQMVGFVVEDGSLDEHQPGSPLQRVGVGIPAA